jgi:hypothetical protein
MWQMAIASPLVAPLLAGALPRKMLRIYGVPESTVADAFEDLGGDGGGTETTICASRSEIEVVIRAPDGALPAAEHLAGGLRERFGRAVFSEGPATLEELVLELLRGQGRTLATAESCTAGLVASRLAGVAGASDVLVGGLITYSNELKQQLLGVPTELLAEFGAVSAECARAMAEGARRVTGAGRRRRVGHRHRRPGRRDAHEAGRSGLHPRRRRRCGAGAGAALPGAARERPRVVGDGRAPSRAPRRAAGLKRAPPAPVRPERLSGALHILTSRPLPATGDQSTHLANRRGEESTHGSTNAGARCSTDPDRAPVRQGLDHEAR